MSFFGFDPNAPPQGRANQSDSQAFDFESTYDGLGEQLDDAKDAFNDETFGASGEIGKDFRFGTNANAAVQKPPTLPRDVSYAQAANTTNDDEFMSELWGSSNPAKKEQQAAPQQAPAPEKRILSLEEIEAQLTAIDHNQRQLPQHQPQMQQFPQQPFGMPGMMPPPPQFGMMPPNGFIPGPPVYGGQYSGIPQQMPPQFFSQQIPNMNQAQQPPMLGVPPQDVRQGISQGIPQGVPQGIPQGVPQGIPQGVPQGVTPQPFHAPQAASEPVEPTPSAPQAVSMSEIIASSPNDELPVHAPRKQTKPVNLSQFPVLGSKEAPLSGGRLQSQRQAFESRQSHERQPFERQRHDFRQGYERHPYENREVHEQIALTPEQQAKAAKRQEKVSRIMRYSGIMNPKDKDFVTRFQLSQIVTEDPYNEDFYAQVFKVIHPNPNQVSQEQEQQNNSIAQAYLDQSGHRLGGRHKRADVALQRMQQQVQRAVTVAKERPKLTQYAREGALGKISIGSGKKPRQQLELFSKAVQMEIEKQEEEGKGDSGAKKTTIRRAAVPVASNSNEVKSYTKKDIMSILENIITNLMTIESESRLSSGVDTTPLWESLRILEQPSPKVNDESEVNPFIQCLNHEKALKIVSRLFKFLSREQILTIATLIMSNLENLNVVKAGSYTKYEDNKIPPKTARLIETHSLTFTKAFMTAVQDFKFNEIIGLLVILIEHNNVSYISTTKVGLSIFTTLLSRAELIRGEGSISATDLSEWSSCYDELFTSLESRIASIFPPQQETEDINESYVWQFLATLALGGKLNHQRIIVDEVRDQIFSVMNRAKALDSSDVNNFYKKQNILNNLNMFLVVMGLVADENEIKELQS